MDHHSSIQAPSTLSPTHNDNVASCLSVRTLWWTYRIPQPTGRSSLTGPTGHRPTLAELEQRIDNTAQELDEWPDDE